MEKLVAVNLAAWVGCFAFVVTLINGLLKLGDRLRGEAAKPSNPELGVSQQDLQRRVHECEEDLETTRAQIARDREADRISATTRSAGIYKKIDEVSDKMAEKQERILERLARLEVAVTASRK